MTGHRVRTIGRLRAGGGIDTDAAAIIAAMTTPPSASRQTVISNTVKQLKVAGIWSKLDVLYFLAAADSQAARLNWKNPATFTASVSGSPTFTTDRGYTGDGVSAFLDTGYSPLTNAISFTRNDNSLGMWAPTIAGQAAGAFDFGNTNNAILPKTSGVTTALRSNSGSSDAIRSLAAPGLYAIQRTNSAGFSVYTNGGKRLDIAESSEGANVYPTHQGWCTDGTYYYTIDTASITKRNRADWSVVSTNASPFAGLTGGGLNHCGSPGIYNGNLYVPIENWSGSCGGSNSGFQIAVFSTSTLALVGSHAVTATELGGVSIDSDNGVIYGANYCDATQLLRWSLTTFAALPSIPLRGELSSIQGVAYTGNAFYLSGLSLSGDRLVGKYDLTGNLLATYRLTDLISGSEEGLSIEVGGNVGVLQDDQVSSSIVRFYDPTTTGDSVVRVSSLSTSDTLTLFKRNGAAVFTTDQIAMAFAGASVDQYLLHQVARYYLSSVGAASA